MVVLTGRSTLTVVLHYSEGDSIPAHETRCARCGRTKQEAANSEGTSGWSSSKADFEHTLKAYSGMYKACEIPSSTVQLPVLHLGDPCERCGAVQTQTSNDYHAANNSAFEHHLKSGKYQACVAANAEEMIRVRDPKLRELLIEVVKTLDVKGRDYTAGNYDADRLHNFHTVAADTGVKPRQAWWVYFYKHLSSIKRWVKDGYVESEPIRGRVVDIIAYAFLGLLIHEEEQKKGEK